MGPGDLNRMFERIVGESGGDGENTAEEEKKLWTGTVKVHSRPSDPPLLTKEKGGSAIVVEEAEERDYLLGAWVITIDGFLTDEECSTLIELGSNRGYKGSTHVGKLQFDGTHEKKVSKHRTSTNAWCDDE